MQTEIVYTCATDPFHKGFLSLQKSFKLSIVNVADRVEWKGMHSKLDALLEAAINAHRKQLIWFIMIDAYDVIAHPQAADKLLFLNSLFETNPDTDFLCGVEELCLSNCGLVQREEKIYLNAGVLAARPSAVIEFVQWASENEIHDDQKALASFANIHAKRFQFDMTSSLLVWNVNPFTFGLVPYAFEFQSPFLHFPGSRNQFWAQSWAASCRQLGFAEVWSPVWKTGFLLVAFLLFLGLKRKLYF